MDAFEPTCPSCGERLDTAVPAGDGPRSTCPRCGHALPPGGPDDSARRPATTPDVAPVADLPVATLRKHRPDGAPVLVWSLSAAGVMLLLGLGLTLTVVLNGVIVKAGPGKASDDASTPVPPAEETPREPRPQDEWSQDWEGAQRQAGAEGKDVLILFDGSDWSLASRQFAQTVLENAHFMNQVNNRYLPVWLDFPFWRAGQALVKNAAANADLKERFLVSESPTVILAEAQGRPFAHLPGYQGDSPANYLKKLDHQRDEGKKFLAALDRVDRAEGGGKLAAAREALRFLFSNHLLGYYHPQVQEWFQLARTLDPRNDQGALEVCFAGDWLARYQKLNRKTRQLAADVNTNQNREELADAAAELERWRKDFRFKDADLAARVLLSAAELQSGLQARPKALELLKEGLAYGPADARLRNQLELHALRIEYAAFGFGFIVSPEGYVVTNQRVVNGPGKVLVRLADAKDPVPAEVVEIGKRARDLAVLRIRAGRSLKALPMQRKSPVKVGEPMAFVGLAMADLRGRWVRLTEMAIQNLPDDSNYGLLLVNYPIPPGLSGGPLCDNTGNVVGMMTAGMVADPRLAFAGQAIPAEELATILATCVKGFKPAPAPVEELSWQEVEHAVRPSVVMVLKSY